MAPKIKPMKNLYIKIGVTLLILSGVLNAQEEWYKTFTGANSIFITKVIQDTNDNWYLTGTFSGSFDADPGVGVSTLTSAGLTDIFLIKLNPEGEFIWAKRYGGVRSDRPNDLEIDNNGILVMVGTFQATINFNSEADPVEFSLLGGNNSSMFESFLLKLEPNGNYYDAYHFRTTSTLSSNEITALAIDSENNLIIAGFFDGAMDIDPTGDTQIINATPSFSDDIFIMKFANVDTVLWAHKIGGIENDKANDIAIDELNNIYLTGHFQDSMDFDPSEDTLFISTTNGIAHDIFIMSLNPDGELRWAKGIGTEGGQFGDKIIYAENDGLYVSGRFSNAVNFNPGGNVEIILSAVGSTNTFLLKLDTQAEVQWARSWTFTGFFQPAFGSDGRILVSNFFSGTVDADPDNTEYNLSSNGGNDFLVLCLNPEGEFIEAFSRGGAGNENSQFVQFENDYYTVAGISNAAFYLNPPFEESMVDVTSAQSMFFARFIPAEPTVVNEIRQDFCEIFPNPAKDFIQIKSRVPFDQIELYDLQSRKIKSCIPNQENVIQVSDLNPGVYLVRCIQGNNTYCKKIVIQ